MLEKKIKGIFQALSGEYVNIDYICILTNEPKEKVLKLLIKLENEKFII